MIQQIVKKLGDVFSLSTVGVFVLSGIYLLLIDRADLSTKGLKWELKVSTIIGIIYIFGSLAFFGLYKLMY